VVNPGFWWQTREERTRSMTAARQLRLVDDKAPRHGTTRDPVRQAFEHWCFMFEKPVYTKLDSERRAVITKAVDDYGLPLVMLAIEGQAARDLRAKDLPIAKAMREVSWFLKTAKHTEDAIAEGEALRSRLQAADASEAQPEPAEPQDAAAQAADLARLRDLARRARMGQLS